LLPERPLHRRKRYSYERSWDVSRTLLGLVAGDGRFVKLKFGNGRQVEQVAKQGMPDLGKRNDRSELPLPNLQARYMLCVRIEYRAD
jgi:hypothetical protein